MSAGFSYKSENLCRDGGRKGTWLVIGLKSETVTSSGILFREVRNGSIQSAIRATILSKLGKSFFF